jgi:hypothetical protein
MSTIRITHDPPLHGWLGIHLCIDSHEIELCASDVPNNPLEALAAAIEQAAEASASVVWWHLEPDGYFMHFLPVGRDIEIRVEFAPGSKPSLARTVCSTRGACDKVLMPFWRFLREFDSHGYRQPHWPATDLRRLDAMRTKIVARRGEVGMS